jgi:O-methyltransferase involved in polyketide biosynthesis
LILNEPLAGGIKHHGFDPNRPAFFSWLGVTPYLTREAGMATLSFIGCRPTGSGVVFDFAIDCEQLSFPQKLALDALSKRVAAAGEPFQLFFDASNFYWKWTISDFATAKCWTAKRSTLVTFTVVRMDCASAV